MTMISGRIACDWPFTSDHPVVINVNGFEVLKLSAEDRHAIEQDNAKGLFPNLVT